MTTATARRAEAAPHILLLEMAGDDLTLQIDGRECHVYLPSDGGLAYFDADCCGRGSDPAAVAALEAFMAMEPADSDQLRDAFDRLAEADRRDRPATPIALDEVG